MRSLIDTSIRPNPYNPSIGDVYGRPAGGLSDGMPLRIVVLRFEKSNPDFDWHVLADGRQEQIVDLPLYLASIDGIEPLGRVCEPGTHVAATPAESDQLAALWQRLEAEGLTARLPRGLDHEPVDTRIRALVETLRGPTRIANRTERVELEGKVYDVHPDWRLMDKHVAAALGLAPDLAAIVNIAPTWQQVAHVGLEINRAQEGRIAELERGIQDAMDLLEVADETDSRGDADDLAAQARERLRRAL